MPCLAAQVPKVSSTSRHRDRRAREIGRLCGDDRGCRVHHHHELLRLRRYFRRGQCVGCQREAGEDVGAVTHDQLLRQPFGDLRGDAADILADHLDLLAGDRVTVLLHIEFDAVVELHAGIGELSGERQDDTDLDGVVCLRGCEGRKQAEAQCDGPQHERLPVLLATNIRTRSRQGQSGCIWLRAGVF